MASTRGLLVVELIMRLLHFVRNDGFVFTTLVIVVDGTKWRAYRTPYNLRNVVVLLGFIIKSNNLGLGAEA
ncbi:MAG: hypothetical protein Q8J84_08790 [Flavobacteriaceae bacterium]|nr:hypothetical protein [Flavobacteriaceae bacterium]